MQTRIIFAGVITVILIAGIMMPAYSEYLSPRKQLESGVLPENIQCKENRVLVIRDNGNPACVRESTADKKNWDIITTEFTQKVITPNDVTDNTKPLHDTIDETIQTTTLTVASSVEFTDDGREIKKNSLQRGPAPWPVYDKIMNSTTGLIVPGPAGASDIPTTPHEKYSINEKVGLYIEDWMPTYIPDGQRLLYADTSYITFEVNGNTYESYDTVYQFVPTSFVLPERPNTHDLKSSNGFTVNITYQTLPLDSIEDAIEYIKEVRESQPANYGGFRDMTRDGKTVLAFEGGNHYNPYFAGLTFHPDENTSVNTLSYYHTLDELIPVFNSIMK